MKRAFVWMLTELWAGTGLNPLMITCLIFWIGFYVQLFTGNEL